MEKKLMRTVNENGGLGSKNTILLSKQKNTANYELLMRQVSFLLSL